MINRYKLLAMAVPLWCGVAFAQANPDRVTVPLSDPSRPALVRAEVLNGSISVKAYSGKEVIVEARSHGRESSSETKSGMRRIPMTGSGLEVEEQNNTVRIDVPAMRAVDLEIQVPVRASLKVSTVNGRAITVEGVNGEIEADATNGSVTLTNISGSAVAHALNGKVLVTFAKVEARPMSFSSMNGTIDVTFPADLKATVKMKSDQGDVYSDFDIVVKAAPQAAAEGSRDARGKYRIRIDHAVYGTINGGGPEIQFSNFNGDIFIRKGK